jgi:hypothetical protein
MWDLGRCSTQQYITGSSFGHRSFSNQNDFSDPKSIELDYLWIFLVWYTNQGNLLIAENYLQIR